MQLQSRMVKPASQHREVWQDDGHATPATGTPASATPATPITPDGNGKERMFASDWMRFNNAAHEITGLSCSQLDDFIAMGERDASPDWDKGLKLKPPGDDGQAVRAALGAASPLPGPAASGAAINSEG